MEFDERQIERYMRHIVLKGVGGEGQKRILASKILIIGAGGLGSPAALYLAAAGVGRLGIVDSDRVELSNLQRQILHSHADLGREKVESAQEKLKAINSDVEVKMYGLRLAEDNIKPIISDYDFIIEGSDNFPTKFVVNDACLLLEKPFSIGGVVRFRGQTMTYIPGTACYRCLFPEEPAPGTAPTCGEAGILGPVAGILGTIQATEALKYVVGHGDLLTNRLLTFDATGMEFKTVGLKRNPNCPGCASL